MVTPPAGACEQASPLPPAGSPPPLPRGALALARRRQGGGRAAVAPELRVRPRTQARHGHGEEGAAGACGPCEERAPARTRQERTSYVVARTSMVREETGGCGPCEERAPLRARAHTALATYALHHTCWRALALRETWLMGFFVTRVSLYIPTLKK